MKFKEALRSLFRNKEEEKELQEFKILIRPTKQTA